MARWLNKAQIIELLNRLDIDCNPNEKYNVLRQRLFRALPEYQDRQDQSGRGAEERIKQIKHQ